VGLWRSACLGQVPSHKWSFCLNLWQMRNRNWAQPRRWVRDQSLPLILAEELAADWSKVIIVPAPPIDALYGNPGFGHVMHTASSASVTGFLSLRTSGNLNGFALQQNSTDYTATSRCKQDPL